MNILTKYAVTTANSRTEFLDESAANDYAKEVGGTVQMVQEEIIEPEPIREPWEVAMFRIRLVLDELGLIPTIEAAIESLPEAMQRKARISWEYGNVIDRYSPIVGMIQQVCQLSDEQADEIFRTAEGLEL